MNDCIASKNILDDFFRNFYTRYQSDAESYFFRKASEIISTMPMEYKNVKLPDNVTEVDLKNTLAMIYGYAVVEWCNCFIKQVCQEDSYDWDFELELLLNNISWDTLIFIKNQIALQDTDGSQQLDFSDDEYDPYFTEIDLFKELSNHYFNYVIKVFVDAVGEEDIFNVIMDVYSGTAKQYARRTLNYFNEDEEEMDFCEDNDVKFESSEQYFEFIKNYREELLNSNIASAELFSCGTGDVKEYVHKFLYGQM